MGSPSSLMGSAVATTCVAVLSLHAFFDASAEVGYGVCMFI